MSKASVYITLSPREGKPDAKALKRELDSLPGVLSVSMGSSGNQVTVDFDTTGTESDRIKKHINKMGYNVLESRLEDHVM